MTMIPSNRLDIEVDVSVDGTWYPGTLEHRRQSGDVWEGFVRWSTGQGENRIGWFGNALLREHAPQHDVPWSG